MTKERNKPVFIMSLDTELIGGYAADPSKEAVSLMNAEQILEVYEEIGVEKK